MQVDSYTYLVDSYTYLVDQLTAVTTMLGFGTLGDFSSSVVKANDVTNRI